MMRRFWSMARFMERRLLISSFCPESIRGTPKGFK